MKPDQLLRAILPDVLIDNFDIDRFEKTDTRFDIWLDEKKYMHLINYFFKKQRRFSYIFKKN